MKVPRDNLRIKQVESSIKLATLTVTNVTLVKIVNDNITHLGPKINTSTIKVVSSPCDSHRGIWVPKHLLTNHEGSNKSWVPKLS
jgi:hypothetical protein